MNEKGLTLAILMLLNVTFVRGDFIFEVRVLSFRNPTRVIPRVPSVCCDGPQVPPNCMDPCDLAIFFCNREFGSDEFSLTNCSFGNIIIDEAISGDEDGDNVDFTIGQPFPTGAPNPLIFEGTAWPGRIQVAVRAFDNDGGALINMATFFNDIVISPAKKFSPPVVYTSRTPVPVNLTLSFRVTCSENFFGPNCTKFCAPRNDSRAHYRCNSEGDIVCLEGYYSPATNCNKTCNPAKGHCQCDHGYWGRHCENTKQSFQVRVYMDYCTTWSLTKISSVIESIEAKVAHVIAVCCKGRLSTKNLISNGQISCRNSPYQATYRGTVLAGGSSGYNATQIVGCIEKWVKTSPALYIDDKLLVDVDPRCRVRVTSLTEPECRANNPLHRIFATSNPRAIRCANICLRYHPGHRRHGYGYHSYGY